MPGKLRNEVFNLDFLRLWIRYASENSGDVLALVLSQRIENLPQLRDAIAYGFGHFVVGVTQLNLLEHREGDRVNEDDATIDTGSVDHQDLLIGLLQRQETRLGVIEGLLIVKVDEILAAFIGAHGQSFLRE